MRFACNPGFREAFVHVQRHLVVRAAARRVVRAVPQQQRPHAVQLVRRPSVPGDERGQRLHVALDQRLDLASLALLVDASRVHVGEEMCARGGSELTSPRRRIRRDHLTRQVVSQAADGGSDLVEDPARAGEALDQRRIRSGVVVPDHDQHPIAPHERPLTFEGTDQRLGELLGSRRLLERRAVEVSERHVLGEDPAPVGGLPPERIAIDRRRHATPHHRALHTAVSKDLRHLSHVAELVRHVSDLQRTPEFPGPGQSALEVADVRLAGREELVHLGEPRAGREPPVAHQTPHVLDALRAHGQVVVDHRGLPVQVEMREARLDQVEQRVHHGEQPLREHAERVVPLSIPVRVRDERHPRRVHGAECPTAHAWWKWPCAGWRLATVSR